MRMSIRKIFLYSLSTRRNRVWNIEIVLNSLLVTLFYLSVQEREYMVPGTYLRPYFIEKEEDQAYLDDDRMYT